MQVTSSQILTALQNLVDPLTLDKLGHFIHSQDIVCEKNTIKVHLRLGYKLAHQTSLLKQQVIDLIRNLGAVDQSIEVQVDETIAKHVVQAGLASLPNIKNIIAVASGKGGVGKSTTTVNLALALAADGARVGILDADIYGPSQPLLLGIAHEKPESKDNKSMEPLHNYGVWANSIGFLIDEDSPAIWRGPMVTGALEQLLKQTNWPDLDYLIVDMPPGTGDIALTLAQKVPVVGAVIVTTPQDIALLDARKGLRMFQKVSVPVLGVVENMSVYVCPNCGHEAHLFGQHGGQNMAKDLGVDWLGELPLTLSIREQADAGKPTVIANPASDEAMYYAKIARKVAIRIAQLEVDTTRHFPKFMMKSVS